MRLLWLFIYMTITFVCAHAETNLQFVGSIEEIPEHIQQLMIGCSWKPECPVSLHDLRYVTVTYWGFDNTSHLGHIVVHAKLAEELLMIFEELFDAHFPIERVEIIDNYDADDERSMAANNSSAFCCRAVTNNPSEFSLHSYGCAIDINPLINPYIKGSQVLPEAGRAYLDRTKSYQGIITKSSDNACYRIFTAHGYQWGGDFEGRVDYQHFYKQINDVL